MVKRLKTAKETLTWLVKMGYALCLPVLVLIGGILLYALNSTRPEARIEGLPLLTVLVWAAILGPVVLFGYRLFVRRRLIRSITAALRSKEHFDPDGAHEVYHDGEGKYLGIDIRNGTILYVHKIRNGAVDVVAMNMSDWLSSEVNHTGQKFSLLTKLPELPRIEIVTPWAQRFHDTLGAMAIRQIGTANAFSSYVSVQLERLERDFEIHIPRFA